MTPRDIHDKALALKVEYERNMRSLIAEADACADAAEAQGEPSGTAEDLAAVLHMEVVALHHPFTPSIFKRLGRAELF